MSMLRSFHQRIAYFHIQTRYYTSSTSSAPVSLPLKKCNYGTVLQVKIQCLTPREKVRIEGQKAEAQDESYDDALSRSNGSAASVDLSAKSHSSQDLPPTSLLGKMKIMIRTEEDQAGINRIKVMLHHNELELSQLKEQIEKNKQALSELQAKAETEINKAQKLILDKDAELLKGYPFQGIFLRLFYTAKF